MVSYIFCFRFLSLSFSLCQTEIATDRQLKEKEKQEWIRQEKEAIKRTQDKKKAIEMMKKLKREVDARQTQFMYEEAVTEEYFNTISAWDEVDYAYIEQYLGREYQERIQKQDREKRIKEAILFEQRLIETFELKRQELLLKLQHAHQKFIRNLEDDSDISTQANLISHAFIASYFELIPEHFQHPGH